MKNKNYENIKHTFNWFIVAETRMVDENGKTFRKNSFILDRCANKHDASKIINEVKMKPTSVHVSNNSNGAVYATKLAKAPRIGYIDANGMVLFEVIDELKIIHKSEFFKG